MSMLGAFFRGAAGAGLVDYANRLDRRDAMAAEDERRKREREEDMAFRAEQARLDRESRADSAATRRRGSGGGGGSGGGAVGDDGMTEMDRQAIADIMKSEKVSFGEAAAIWQANQRGENVFTLPVGGDGVGPPQFDPKRWSALNTRLSDAVSRSTAMGRSNIKEVREGEQTAWQTASGQAAQRNPEAAPMLARGVAVSGGKPLVSGDSNVTRDNFTGRTEITPVGKSVIAENMAQAGSANRANRDKDPKNDISWLKKEYETVTGEIAKARAAMGGDFDPENKKQHQALVDRALDLEGQLRAANQSVDNGAIGGAVTAILAAARKAKDGAKTEPSKPASANPAEDARFASKEPTKPMLATGSLREQWLKEQRDKQPQKEAAKRAAADAAIAALDKRDQFAAEDAMKMPGFNDLDQEMKVAVRKLVMGIR